ncbi:universal stress protein [Paractinoplanes deccanensis]|uniref:Universal stress protein n=1 Tax=Paractinoplanes deccanensis TaxID=113561 RepID=A0ABQ3YH87_9ACTN|nr:universal stress protein [Actinoplanes deccanensis]GID79361.1 universal stress protein [Actinoplanes deccanensis]
MNKTKVVVGVDGSAGSLAAVRWAAREARMREAELRVLIARHRHESFAFDARKDDTAGAVHTAVQQARAAAPGVEVRALALTGYAVPVLVHAAEDAALVVVGSHGDRGFFGQAHGTVCGQVATQAQSSVVVVRGAFPEDGPVVVGVNDDPGAGTIIGRAFDEAAMRGVPLVAVTAHDQGSPRVTAAAEEALGAEIDLQLDPWREKYPQVRATREVIGGRPDKVLVQRCRQAQLVVVGPRRHGYEGVLLGPVGTRLLQRAECPVLIARA